MPVHGAWPAINRKPEQGFVGTKLTSSGRSMGSAARPLADLGGHSHWVWQARFCPAHDCLLLSGSSDALVNLWYAPWISTATTSSLYTSHAGPGTLGHPEEGPGAGRSDAVVTPGGMGGTPGGPQGGGPRSGGTRSGAREGRVRAFDDHEDSVYSAPLLAHPSVMLHVHGDPSYGSNRLEKCASWRVHASTGASLGF